MSLSQAVQDAIARLRLYNLGLFNSATNPYGVSGRGGMAANWGRQSSDMATVGSAVADLASSATTSESNAAASVTAAAGSAATAAQQAVVAAAAAATAVGTALVKQPAEIAGIDPSLDLILSSSLALPAGVVTGASAKAVFDRSGLLTSVAAGTPPIDFDPATAALRGLCVEASRANILLGSDAPATQTVTVGAAAHTLSFYGTGTITLSGAYAATVVGAGSFPAQKTLTFTPAAGSLTVTVSGTVQYAQLEAGTSASSYIRTVGSVVTRAVDANSVALGAIPGWVATEMTVCAEYSLPALLSGVQRHPVVLHDGVGSNQVRVGWMDGATGGTNCGYLVAAGGATQVVVNPGGVVTAGPVFRVAMALKSGRAAQSINGAAAVVTTPASLPTGLTTLQLGARHGGSEPLNGWLRRVTIFPRALSDSTLQFLTA
jgi:hypothetical protein